VKDDLALSQLNATIVNASADTELLPFNHPAIHWRDLETYAPAEAECGVLFYATPKSLIGPMRKRQFDSGISPSHIRV
jgi:hypothetical protein